ncbi:MAG: hypothetical protein [Podoviridae sp. ctda_1]|nr:MAG: hypothetical protein [Podoviridae sp. ctda_1]
MGLGMEPLRFRETIGEHVLGSWLAVEVVGFRPVGHDLSLVVGVGHHDVVVLALAGGPVRMLDRPVDGTIVRMLGSEAAANHDLFSSCFMGMSLPSMTQK